MIKAKKNNNDIQETVETRKITYEKVEEEKVEEIKKVITLEIVDTATWIRLDVDDINQLTQVVEPSKKEYEFNEKFYIMTGRIGNTKIFFNEEELSWPANPTKAVFEMTCILNGEVLDCK